MLTSKISGSSGFNRRSLGVVAPLALAIAMYTSGCTKDKSSDDLQNETQAQNYAKYKKVAGTYSGKLFSRSKQQLGGVIMKLEVNFSSTFSPSGGSSQTTPTMTATLQSRVAVQSLQNSDVTTIAFQNDSSGDFCKFTPDQGVLSAAINFTLGATGSGGSSGSSGGGSNSLSAATKVNVQLDGAINNGHFSGRIYAQGYSDLGLSVELDQDGPTLDQITSTLSIIPDSDPEVQAYTGHVFFPETNITNCTPMKVGGISGQNCPVNLLVERTDNTDQENFIGLFYPRHPVTLQFDFGGSALFALTNAAILARDSNRLSTPLMMPSGAGGVIGNIGIDCGINSGDSSFDCSLLNARGQTLRAHFKPVDNPPDLVGLEIQGSQAQKYKGMVEGISTKIAATLVMNADNLSGLGALQQLMSPTVKYINLAELEFTDSSSTVPSYQTFSGCTAVPIDIYNEQNHTFSACGITASTSAPVTFNCTDIFFDDAHTKPGQPYDFSCNLISRGALTIHFKGTF